jgi:hypothetical protein
MFGDPPVEHSAVAQHCIDVAGDMPPVLGADVPAAAKIFGGDIVGRPSAGFDCSEDIDRSSDTRAWGQELAGLLSPVLNPSLPGLTRQSTWRGVDARVKPGHDEENRDC